MLAERLDDPGLRVRTAQWRFDTSVERGHGEQLERLLEVAGENARSLRMGNYHHSIAYARAALALLRGRAGEADALVERARLIGHERGVDATVVDAVRLFQLIGVRHEQQRLPELREEAYLFIEAASVPEWFGGLAFIDAAVGQLDAVATNVDKLLHAFLEHGPTFVSPIGYLAHMAGPIAQLGDAERATLVYEQVLPFAGLGAYFANFAGPIDYHLGLLARTLGSRPRTPACTWQPPSRSASGLVRRAGGSAAEPRRTRRRRVALGLQPAEMISSVSIRKGE